MKARSRIERRIHLCGEPRELKADTLLDARMKYLVEVYPPAEVKNAFELDPEKQEKVGKAIEKMEPLSAWFTFRYGFIVIEAASPDELTRKIGPLFHLFETDLDVSPAYSLEEFPTLVATIGEEARKYV